MPSAERDIFLVCQENDLTWNITKKLVKKDYALSTCSGIAEALGKVLDAPPALIIVHEPLIKGKTLKLLKDFKRDDLFAHIPVILLAEPEWATHDIDWSSYPVDDYLTTALTTSELANRVALCINRLSRSFDPNPLTRLPGNTSILREIQRVLDTGLDLAICYLDIDNFKAFNDKYGFARGDEALRMTARILSNVVQDFKQEYAFVGHIGGDDFVFVAPAGQVEDACTKIIKSFDAILPSLYDEDARKRGYIASRDRAGKHQSFPLMSVSIAVVINNNRQRRHYGEISEIASQIKKQVKKKAGSNFMINRRQ